MNIFLHTKNRKGFTVLFAVLVASILLAVGASIFNITLKNILFSSSGRESLKALSAANSGLECAEYWDRNGDSMFGAYNELSNTGSVVYLNAQCMGTVLTRDREWNTSSQLGSDGKVITQFKISEPVCASVTIIKSQGNFLPASSVYGTKTVIESRGYNTCDETNNRRLERGVKITYYQL